MDSWWWLMKETFIIIALASNDVTNVCQLLQDFFHFFFKYSCSNMWYPVEDFSTPCDSCDRPATVARRAALAGALQSYWGPPKCRHGTCPANWRRGWAILGEPSWPVTNGFVSCFSSVCTYIDIYKSIYLRVTIISIHLHLSTINLSEVKNGGPLGSGWHIDPWRWANLITPQEGSCLFRADFQPTYWL